MECFLPSKKHKNRLASVIFAKMDLTITPIHYPVCSATSAGSSGRLEDPRRDAERLQHPRRDAELGTEHGMRHAGRDLQQESREPAHLLLHGCLRLRKTSLPRLSLTDLETL